MANDFSFASWRRSSMFRLASGAKTDGRLQGALQLQLTDTKPGGAIDTAQDQASFLFLGPRDLDGIDARVVLRTGPKALDHDAEATKLTHIDLLDPDFPWRYTLDAPPAGSSRVRPWLVLLAGTADELEVKQGTVNVRSDQVYLDHDLAQSWRWAHLQVAPGREFSRLLSPRTLPPMSACVGVLVPAFDDNGEDAWQLKNGAVSRRPSAPLRALYSFTFQTAEAGDFESLAAALQVRSAGDLGRASIGYQLPDQPAPVTVPVRGAITARTNPPLTIEQQQQLDLAKLDLAPRVSVQADIGGRPTIGLPLYGRPWFDQPRTTAWGEQLFADLRYRGTAGVGLWLALETQEKLLTAALEQAGALVVARKRVANLVFGLNASRSLWSRRLPVDPLLRLWVLAPAMARMAAVSNGVPAGTVLSQATGAASPLPPALFSSAARRLLRRRTSVTRHLKTSAGAGVLTRSDILTTANRCPLPFRDPPDGLPHGDSLAAGLGVPTLGDLLHVKPYPASLIDFVQHFVGRPLDPNSVAHKVTEFLAKLLGTPPVDPLTLPGQLSAAWVPHAGQLATEAELLKPLARFFTAALDPNQRGRLEQLGNADDVVDFFRPDAPATPDPCRPRNLDALSAAVAQAIDPTREPPPVLGRVADTIIGIDIRLSLGPPQLPITLQLPTWTLLRDYEPAKDWLLPGIDTLPKDSVVALASNPEFIDAFLLGLNTQFKNELHWRQLADDPAATTFTMFWGTISGANLLAKRIPDVRPITDWAAVAPLGDTQHQYVEPGQPQGNRDLVIVFRTDLFRRYPTTQVYMRPLVGPADSNAEKDALQRSPDFSGPAGDLGPIFQGTLAPDVCFFIFDLAPEQLDNYWVMLEEPPTDLRFKAGIAPAVPDAKDTSASYAQLALDHPTRVAISWTSLGGGA